jgi:hypothetical protein
MCTLYVLYAVQHLLLQCQPCQHILNSAAAAAAPAVLMMTCCQAKQRVLQVVEQLELQHPVSNPFQNNSSSSSSSLSPIADLLGDWDLVYANNGTVRRTPASAIVPC